MDASAPGSPREQLAQMATGYWLSQMLYVAARLGLADRLSRGPLAITQLAAETSTQPEPLYRLCRALASLGIFTETDPHRFALTPTAEFLRDDHPQTVRPLVLMMGDTQYAAWGQLLFSVQSGQPAFPHVFGRPLFDYLADHPTAAAEFDRAMVAIHGRETAAVLAAYTFQGCRKLVDVGGGNGSQLMEVLQHHPGLHGVVYDLPHVADRARAGIAHAGLAGRCDVVGGDFFQSVPAAGETYLLRHILHDWDDAACLKILHAIRQVIPPDGRLLVIETVLPPGNDPCFAKLLDITMLVVPGGLERTREQYQGLFAAANFALVHVTPTTAGVDVIEARPV
jgi:hypothetical protein